MAAAGAAEVSGKAHPSFLRGLTLALAAGLAAGLVAWVEGEAVFGYFVAPLSPVSVGPMVLMQATTPAVNAADVKNATLAFAILGSSLGLLLGVAGGLVRRDPRRCSLAGVVGWVLGGLVGALASMPFLALFYRQNVADPNDFLLPLLMHAGIWCPIGAVGGLAFGLGSGGGPRLLNAAIGGFLGAAIATILFEIIGIGVFPDDRSTDPLANTWVLRLLARLLVAVFAALGAAIAARETGATATTVTEPG
jgi:hypothetical protein